MDLTIENFSFLPLISKFKDSILCLVIQTYVYISKHKTKKVSL